MEVNSAPSYVTSESTAVFDYFSRLISKIGVWHMWNSTFEPGLLLTRDNTRFSLLVHRLLSLRHGYPRTVKTKIWPSDDHGGSYPRLLHSTYHECEYNKSKLNHFSL